ncbi:hypothetical protein WICMUC_005426 [Wickerhamomyces mucosus]|uniref:Manganese resistance protein MNR2 n=1 Tax=Wickerhamomyces mucosus TaxID=1378264 RepID=A0A9P8P9D3_9ASCO|nr:hypothetical protein WICMUC_005426 [Wickerhamomyces mucosus]
MSDSKPGSISPNSTEHHSDSNEHEPLLKAGDSNELPSSTSTHNVTSQANSDRYLSSHYTAPSQTKTFPKRRLTFSGPNDIYSIERGQSKNFVNHSVTESGLADGLGNGDTRSSSITESSASNVQNVLNDLRSYDLRNLPSAKTQSSRFRRQSLSNNTFGDPNPTLHSTYATPSQDLSAKQRLKLPNSADSPSLNRHQSPTLAEKWVNGQRKLASRSYGSIANPSPMAHRIDMDNYNSSGHNQNSAEDNTQHGSELDFRSKPSSRRTSKSSSLDDVCFPLDQLDDAYGDRLWPDIKVLEEFCEEETTRLKDEALKETSEANYRFNFNNDDNSSDLNDASSSGGVGFSHPIVTKVDAPKLLGNQRINETETLNGRLRPPKINPFDRKRLNNAEFLKTINYPPHIIQNSPEHFRFTYFREDLDSTVHSPTISGLLQPGQKFDDIFLYTEYSKNQNQPGTAVSQASSHGGSHSITSRETTPAVEGLTSITPPAPDLEFEPDHIAPFWLDILNPTEEEMKVLSKAFSIHPLTTEDIFLGETREKVELFKEYYFVCFRSFDIVQEKIKRRNIYKTLEQKDSGRENLTSKSSEGFLSRLFGTKKRRQSSSRSVADNISSTSSFKKRAREIELEKFKKKSGDRHKPKGGELEPLNVYILVFKHAVLTFHFAPSPHPVNVRRRARLLREYLTVSADWIAYALIDDITDAFGPMIESIEDEVNSIEDAILKMHPGNESDSDDSDGSDDEYDFVENMNSRRESVFDDKRSLRSISTNSTRSTSSNIIEWKKKGDMLKRVGESRKRVMSLLRLLGSKPDVIKGFAKRCNEQWEVAPRSEIGMYLGDIQDHIVTMIQSLNHYEKLLARSHSNYLAQINIDMTKVNNDTNDVLGKITILGTVVLPMNIITGLWGMNVLVPGQDYDGLLWFWGLVAFMFCIAISGYMYAKRVSGLD